MDDAEQALVDAIAAAADPIPPSLALAAWLKGQDDEVAAARGELIELQAASERGRGTTRGERRCRALIKEHLDAWTGELPSRLGLKATLRLGFVTSFTIGSDAPGLVEDPSGELLELFEHPMFRFVREADVGVFGSPSESLDQNGEYAHYELTPLFDAIAEAYCDEERPVPLRAVTLGFPQRDRWRPLCGAGHSRRFAFASAGVSVYDAVERLPALETLRLRCGLDDAFAMEPWASHLVHLECRPTSFYHPAGCRVITDITQFAWPRLESLAIGRTWYANWRGGSRMWGREDRASVDQLAPIFAGETAPRLRALSLTETDLADEVCAALAAAPLAGQLTALSLARSPLTGRGVEALAANAARFPALTRLDVAGCGLDEAAAARLRGAFAAATVDA